MNLRHFTGLALLSLVAACGGGGEGPFDALVSFGDSLSDVGTYRTPGVRALGGGQYTVNGAPVGPVPALNWTELMALVLELPAPCAARTGLESSGPLAGLAAPVADHGECDNYAQGGSRVENPVGPWNKALLGVGNPSGYLGQLTEPVTAQVARHLGRHGGRFEADEFVTVWAGANDLFMQLYALQAAIAGGTDPAQAAQAAVQAMGTAGTALATLVRDQMVAKGARRVLVLQLPDVGLTPFATAQGAPVAGTMTAMAQAFNATLTAGLASEHKVLLVDMFTASRAEAASPAEWGLTNVSTPACDNSRMVVPSALVCSSGTVIAGDVTHYQYSDDVHPTPWGHLLVASVAYEAMTQAHWVH